MELAPTLTVLIVDDDATMRHLLRRWILDITEAEIHDARNGLEALEVIAKQPVDLLLTDINMPVLDGVDMISLIKSDPTTASMEVAVVSVVAVEDKVRDILKLGVTDYLLKPLHYEQTVRRLNGILARARDKADRRAQKSASGTSRVLICDADLNFCDFSVSALGANFSVEKAQSVAQTLVLALRWRPEVVLLANNMSGVNLEFLAAKLQKLFPDKPPAIFLLTDSKSTPVDSTAIAGVIKKSFVAETFHAAVVEALNLDQGVSAGPLGWFSTLQPEIESGVLQSFGMMTGVEPEVTDGPGDAKFDVFGAICMDASSGDFRLAIELHCERAFAKAMVAVMRDKQEAELAGDAVDEGVNELLKVVAGRVQNWCSQRDIALGLRPPETGYTRVPPFENPSSERVYNFVWKQEHAFEVRFAATASGAVPASGAVAGEPAGEAQETPVVQSASG